MSYYKRAPHSQTSPDTLDVVLEQEQHEPVTPDRHAELVSCLIAQAPNAWRVIFRPSIYFHDQRDQRIASGLEAQWADLRVRFNYETNWDAINEIIRRCLSIDARLYRMSIGSVVDGRKIYGEAI